MYKVDIQILRSCKKHLTEYLLVLAELRADATTVKEQIKIEKKMIKVGQTIRKLKNYEI
jgi:hypothetical protein